MRMAKTVAILALLFAFGASLVLAQRTATAPKVQEPLSQFVDKHFDRWDRNRDGALDLEEIDRKVEDHSVAGREAAVIFRIRQHVTGKGAQPRLTRQQLLSLAQDQSFEKSAEATARQLQTIDRELFLPADPDLSTFHQGRLGDCYLLCTIAAQAHRSPTVIRGMIRPLVTGGFEVVFGDSRKIQVARLTDTELLLGAQLDSRHGSWLAVLEKAYGIIREHDRKQQGKYSANAGDSVPTETLGGGSPGPIISLLTGKQAGSLVLGKKSSAQQVHNLLGDMTKKRRLLCVCVDVDKPPPGMGNHHCYAIFAYDAKGRQVTVFNPWGNTFTPKGPAGPANGYPTKQGLFTVPLDQFQQVFTRIYYETDKPPGK